MTSVRFAAVALCLLTAATACVGGQSGTETPAPVAGRGEPPMPDRPDAEVQITSTTPCPCSLADGSALLRVRLLAIDACQVRARVAEVLAVAPGLTLGFEVGDELEATRKRAPGCGSGLGLVAGDEALLAYAPSPDAGATGGEALVATWGSRHIFSTHEGAELALPADQRDRLIDPPACASWFDEHPAPNTNPDPGTPDGCTR